MSFNQAYFFVVPLCLVAACGGSVFTGDGGGNEAGKPGGGSSSHAGTSSTAGSGGSSTSGGSKNMGTAGTVSMAGAISVGGTSNCGPVACAFPVCEYGQDPVTLPGECCPSCPPVQTGCDKVVCEPMNGCPAGYEPGRPSGACCEGCIPIPGMVACNEIACPPENHCPLGYAPGDTQGGCCYDCVPDPLFCNTKDDCLVADRPRSCCGCPEAISTRQYEADECWSVPSAPRMIPQECYPAFTCDAICGPCPPIGPVACSANRCTQLPAP